VFRSLLDKVEDNQNNIQWHKENMFTNQEVVDECTKIFNEDRNTIDKIIKPGIENYNRYIEKIRPEYEKNGFNIEVDIPRILKQKDYNQQFLKICSFTLLVLILVYVLL